MTKHSPGKDEILKLVIDSEGHDLALRNLYTGKPTGFGMPSGRERMTAREPQHLSSVGHTASAEARA